MKTRRALFYASFVLFLIAACNAVPQTPSTSSPAEPAKNIILFIADGTGTEVIGLARDYARIMEERELWLERVISEGHLALVHAPGVGKLVTDSAAAATAIATGEETVNKAISVTLQGEPLQTILELARKDSRSTGLVTTTRLTHATPACFAAHVQSRDSEDTIASQLVQSGADVMMGGGLAYWIPKGTNASGFARFTGASDRKDGLNLLEKACEHGYSLVCSRNELLSAPRKKRLLGLFSASHLPYAIDRRPDDDADVPSLAEMTQTAINILARNEKGFFLMIEGGRIDHAAHSNDIATLIAETIDFDDAVGIAYAFANKHPHTAIFITADHATGAPCISARYSDEVKETLYPDDTVIRKISRQNASFEYIMRSLVQNPSIEKLKRLILVHTGIEISDEDAEFILRIEPVSPFHVLTPKARKLGYPVLAMGHVLRIEYETTWATGGHYAAPVLLVGYGPRSELVQGYVENDDIFHIMKTAGGL